MRGQLSSVGETGVRDKEDKDAEGAEQHTHPTPTPTQCLK